MDPVDGLGREWLRVDTDEGGDGARTILANLEQLRWILGDMLETKSLEAVWPFRLVISASAPENGAQWKVRHGYYLLALRPGQPVSYERVAEIFLQTNTRRLPPEIDHGLPLLFKDIEARGPRVTWGKKPVKPDLDWARVRLFPEKPAYAGRFPVFLNNLRAGALLSVAEANAFGKDSKSLEQEIGEFERQVEKLQREKDAFPDCSFKSYFRRLIGLDHAGGSPAGRSATP